jgi:hypothetical protein
MTATHVTILGARTIRHDETPDAIADDPAAPDSRKDSAGLKD